MENNRKKGVLTLENSITIFDGSEVTQVEYDFSKVGLDKVINMPTLGNDIALCAWYGREAILAANPKWNEKDVGKLGGDDAQSVVEIGKNFLKKRDD